MLKKYLCPANSKVNIAAISCLRGRVYKLSPRQGTETHNARSLSGDLP